MGSLNSIKLRSELRNGMTETVVNDTPIAIRLRYTSTGSVTSVTVTTATDLVLVTSDGGTETFTFATFTTMGALAEAVNNSRFWDAKLLDALRSDVTTGSELNDGAITVSGDYFDVTTDTSTELAITYRCTFDRSVGQGRPKGAHRVHLKGFTYLANVNAASANGVRVYEYDPVVQTEVQVYQTDSVDNSSTNISFASGEGEISSGWGNDLIVRIQDGTSLSDTSLRLEVSYDRE